MSAGCHLLDGVKPDCGCVCGHRFAQMGNGLQRFDVLDEFLKTKGQPAFKSACRMDDHGRIGLKTAPERHDGFMGGLHIIGVGGRPSS